jgi:3-deoxy-manno-octulosonate cytidylyltransferase (CMP-KDO synthetase)
MRFSIIIPSRYESTRLPGKPLCNINGKPMIQCVYEKAQLSDAFDIYVATDDKRIFDCIKKFGGNVIITKNTHRSGTERLAEAVNILKMDDEDIIVNLQGDEPFMPFQNINQVAKNISINKTASIATLSYPITTEEELNNTNVVKVISSNNMATSFSRSRLNNKKITSSAALKHIGIYAYKAGFLREFTTLAPCKPEISESLEQLRALFHDKKIHIEIAEQKPGMSIDTKSDLEKANKLTEKTQ